MQKINPFDAKRRDDEVKLNEERHKKRAAALKAKRKDKKGKKSRREGHKAL